MTTPRGTATMIVALLLACSCNPAAAQIAPDKLPPLQTANAASTAEIVPQRGGRADRIVRTLRRIKLPPGFRISAYAIVPDARHMAVSKDGGMVFVGTYRSKVWAATDRDHDHKADEVRAFAPAVRFRIPNGVCFAPDGALYVAELNRVLVFPAAETTYAKPDVPAFIVVKQGELIPASEESRGHAARVCRIGPDDKLYIAIGQPYNVPPRGKLALYDRLGIGGIIRMDRDGTNRDVFARGIRNSVGMAFNPADGALWFTDNQVDGMGDLIPPGELNRASGPGRHFGFPWYGGGTVRTKEYSGGEPPKGAVPPEVEMDAHAADLGMTFYTGAMFPARYRGGIFSAQHGSWNRTKPIGARVMFTAVKSDGSAGESSVFAEGWLDETTGKYSGRPVDVAQLPDGSLLVSDDFAGAIYRITYEP